MLPSAELGATLHERTGNLVTTVVLLATRHDLLHAVMPSTGPQLLRRNHSRSEQVRPTAPGVQEYPPRTNSDGYQQRTYPPQQTSPPPLNNSTQRQSLPNFPTTQPATQRVRLDRIASLDNAAQTGVRLRLVSDERSR